MTPASIVIPTRARLSYLEVALQSIAAGTDITVSGNTVSLSSTAQTALAEPREKTGKTEIYTSDLFFGDVLRWTGENKQIIGPRWAPDGSRIVFTSYRTSFPDISQLHRLSGN